MRRNIISAVVLALVSIFIGACSDSTAPSLSPALVLTVDTVTISSGGEDFVRVEASAKNTGDVVVHYRIGCNHSVPVIVKDKDGVSLVLSDPSIFPACRPGFDSLLPGESVESGFNLNWAWDEDGNKYRIPPGNYTVLAVFKYYLDKNDDALCLEKELLLDLD